MNREFLENLGLGKEVVDKIIKEHGKSVQELNTLKEAESTWKTEKGNLESTITKLQADIKTKDEKYADYDDLAGKITTLETKELKRQVAHENSIPFELADKLSGTTKEELEADAKQLASFVTKKDVVLPLKTETETKEKDPYADLVKELEGA